MPVPKNDELAMLRDAQRSGFSMADMARQIGKSANSSADIILKSFRPKEPRITGYNNRGEPLYPSVLPFLPDQTSDQNELQRMIMEGMVGGGMPGGSMLGAVQGAKHLRGMPRPAPTPAPNASGYGARPFGEIPASFGDQFANINYGPSIPGFAKKAAAGAGIATGVAALAGGMGGGQSPTPQPQGGPQFMDYMNAAADIPKSLASMSPAVGQVPAVDPTLAEPIRASGRDKRRGMPVSEQDRARKAQQEMQRGVSASPMPMQGGQSQMQQSRNSNAPSYWVDLMQAADSGDAYARDFMVLREQAREAAQQAAMQGSRDQYVPLMDYRNNTVHIVNAAGNDVVLDLADPQDRAQYAKIAAQAGDPTMFQRWMQRASAPLMGYFRAPGSGTTAPQFSPDETIRLQQRVG